MSDITWTPITVKLADLNPWSDNPRRISPAAAKRLLKSWQDYGQVQTVAIGPNGEVYDGHQRLSTLQAAYGDNYEVLALQASRQLTEEERRELTLLLHSGAAGEWDWEKLATWDTETLKAGGLDEQFYAAMYDGVSALKEVLDLKSRTPLDEEHGYYTRKIKPPTYEPRDDVSWTVSDLFKADRYYQLLDEINSTPGLTDDEREFLRLAATRHIIFNFERVGDYYASASPAMQEMLEHSAMVIIDIGQAIELGFVQMVDKLRELYEAEYGSEDE